MAPRQKPGKKPATPGEYVERGPRGGKVEHERHVTMTPGDKLPPTQHSGNSWELEQPAHEPTSS